MREPSTARPSFAEALRFWHKLGWINFGGPAGQIAIMQHELVDRRGWIDQNAFLHALNFCMLLPGPEATQLAAYVGWRLHGWRGATVAGILFILPSVLVLYLLSWLVAVHGETGPVAALLYGIKPAVIAIVVHAVWRIGRRALKGKAAVALAGAAFVAIAILGVDFPLIVAAAALIGLLTAHLANPPFAPPLHAVASELPVQSGKRRDLRRALTLVAVFVALWAVPVFGVIALYGWEPFADVARVFTATAFVTFGGAYAVLPYIADVAVNEYGWLTAGDMVNGLALAETTPGPLIMVLQYVGFHAGWNYYPESLTPLGSATVAALLTTYVTFLPSFLLILLGAPYIESLGRSRLAGSALGAITAAVVGVILNLAVFFGLAVFRTPAGIDWLAIGLSLVALFALLRFGLAVHWLVLAGAGFGVARALLV